MTGLNLLLLDGVRRQAFAGVRSLVAEDASGQFGLQPGHEDFITVLEPGLWRWRSDEGWHWAGSTGGLLHCRRAGAEVRIVSRRFVLDDEPEALRRRLDAMLAAEHSLRLSTRESRIELETVLRKRLQQLTERSP